MASTIIGLVIELRLDKCRGARRAGAKFTTLVQIRQKKTEPALTALSAHNYYDLPFRKIEPHSGNSSVSEPHTHEPQAYRCHRRE